MLLIFDMHDITGALFLKDSFFFLMLSILVPATVILHFTTIYVSLVTQISSLRRHFKPYILVGGILYFIYLLTIQ